MMSAGRIINDEPNTSTNISSDSCELRRGPWTTEEDNLLVHNVTLNGEGRWNSLAKSAGLKRTGKSCRLRWLNYLKPDIKLGNLSPHEQLLILGLHSKWGNRWSRIAQHLPGRTDNLIKNYWRTRVQRQARQLQLDSNSDKFLEVVRAFWKPAMEMEHYCQSISESPVSGSVVPAAALEIQNPEFPRRLPPPCSTKSGNLGEMATRQQQPQPDENEGQIGRHVVEIDWFPGGCTFWDTAGDQQLYYW